jgi:hypothetical protein
MKEVFDYMIVNKLTWLYNSRGHVEVWKGEVDREYMDNNESDIYFQTDYDVEAFFENIGLNHKDILYGEWNVADDTVGYFDEGDE